MAHQTLSQRLKLIAGVTLLAFGFLLLFANLDAVAASLSDAMGMTEPQGADTFLAVGLAGMHALQTYAFEPSQFVSSVRQILVSFWPLSLVILGALLLRDAFERILLSYSASISSLANGERS